MNEDPDKRFDSTLLKARCIYAKDFQRYCNELCLSPQARAKIANIGMQQQEDKSLLLEILGGDEDQDSRDVYR
nr:MAG TPA: terminase small subunit [Caudoviricetes sp.]